MSARLAFVAPLWCSLLGTPCQGAAPTADDATAPVVVQAAEPVVGSSRDQAPGDQAPGDQAWTVVIGEEGAVGAAGVGKNLTECGDARLDPQTNQLKTTPGVGVVAAARKFAYGDDNNLNSESEFGDCEVALEFLLGKGSNSGVKLQQRYEVQLFDSQGKSKLSGADCGGVYPHWVFAKDGNGITYIDGGVPPLADAAGTPGRWQKLRIVFTAPRFDQQGGKTQNARFVSVELNGVVVQRDVELESPTGNASSPLPEVAKAPLYLQMDHGAVAFRNVRVKPR